MNNFDDFPVSPGRTVDAKKYFDAYGRALKIFKSIPAKDRGANPERTLGDLVHQLYDLGANDGALFRAALGASEEASAYWLSQVRSLGEWVVATSQVAEFRGVPPGFPELVAKTSASKETILQVSAILMRYGIVLVHQIAPAGAKVDGCAFMLKSGHPVIGMSLRYSRLDYYYFTLMHEIAHVVLHYNLLGSPILDDMDQEDATDQVEIDANIFARDALIPRNVWRTSALRRSYHVEDLITFAAEIGVAPQIVAGRIRRDTRRYDLFSNIVHEMDVRRVLGA